MNEIKQKKFYLISLITTYAVLKEDYSDVVYGIEKQETKDINKIISLLQPLEKFITIPDKKDYINKSFLELEKIFCCDSMGKEGTFFQKIHEYGKILDTTAEKEEVLNILLYVINIDNKITDIEKELLLQVADKFGIDHDYNKLLKSYKKSALKKPVPILKMSLIASIIILPLLGLLYYFSLSNNHGVTNVFNDKKIMFSKITFNRFVIYQNKYDVESTHFAKQAVFNIYGTAEVGFEPKNLTYDAVSKILTYHLPKTSPYMVEMSSKVKLIDQANPVPLSEEEAKKLASGVAIVGGLAGAKVGSSLGSLYPGAGGKIGGAVLGGVGGGVTSGLLAYSGLSGLKVSKDISRKERKIVVEGSKEKIQNLLELSPDLTQTYEKSFERYIKTLYALHGLEVKKIEYDNSNIMKSGV